MAVVINATPGDPAANAYLTVEECFAILGTRLPNPAWENADDPAMLVVMATTTFETEFFPRRELVRYPNQEPYYRTRPTWTGVPTTTTQALLWPRTGMYSRTGAVIGPMVVPYEIKTSVAILASGLASSDLTATNDVIVQGITSVKASTVAVSFNSTPGAIQPHVLPDAAFNVLVPSWLTDALIEYAGTNSFEFDVMGGPVDTAWYGVYPI